MIFEFGSFTLDLAKRELSADGKTVGVEAKVFDVLCHLIEHRDHVVSKDDLIASVWDGRLVSDAAVSTAIKAARRAIGDDGDRQTVIKTVRGRGFRFIGDVQGGYASPPPASRPAQDIRYCSAADGTRIAYGRVGTGPVMLRTGNWMTHLEYELESPLWQHWVAGLSRNRCLLRYDQRGNGLSDRRPKDVSFDTMVGDLESVVAASELDHFTLLGMSQGSAVAIEYAARHPERVNALILYGGYARGWEHSDLPDKDHYRALNTLIRTGWGQDNPAFRQLFTSAFMPDATEEHQTWFNDLQRETVQADIAAALYEAFGNFNVQDRLEGIAIPTLVLHARDDQTIPASAGRSIAARIPGARLATFNSRNHILMAHEPAFASLLDEVDRFLNDVL